MKSDILVKVTLFVKALIIVMILSLCACSLFSNNQQSESKKINQVSQQLLYLWDDTPAYLTYDNYSDFTGKKGYPLDAVQIGTKILIVDEYGNLRVGSKLIAKFPSHIKLAKFSPNNKLLVVGTGLTVEVYDTLTGQSVGSLSNHRTRISSIGFSEDSKLVLLGGSDSRIYLWRLEEQSAAKKYEQKFLELYPGHSSIVSSVQFKDDTYFLSGDWAGSLKLWKLYEKITDNVRNLSLSRYFIAQKAVYNINNGVNQVFKTYISSTRNMIYTLDDLGNIGRWTFEGLKRVDLADVGLTGQTKVIAADFYDDKLIVSSRDGKTSIWVFKQEVTKIYDEDVVVRFVKFLNDKQIFTVNDKGEELVIEL